MDLDRLLHDLPWYVLPVTVFVLTVFVALIFRPRSNSVAVKSADSFDDRARIYDTSPLDEQPTSFLAEKRKTLRREGNPIPVRMSRDLEGERSEEAFVVDRSTTGMQIWSKRRIPAGAMVRVKAHNAPDGTPWVFVQVCRVGKNRKFYELGCQFTQDVPWSVLLLFG